MRLVLLLASLVLAFPSLAAADESLWALMRGGGQIILMRHAVTTPRVGDPVGFRLEDCSTRRNLTDAGREDARRVGVTFRARGIPGGRRAGRRLKVLHSAPSEGEAPPAPPREVPHRRDTQ